MSDTTTFQLLCPIPKFDFDIIILGHGINACIIGEVTATHPGKVMMKSSIGGHRIVGYLTGEQLSRIC